MTSFGAYAPRDIAERVLRIGVVKIREDAITLFAYLRDRPTAGGERP